MLGNAEAIGWTSGPREQAEQRRGFEPDAPPAERAKNRSLLFDDLHGAELRELNPSNAKGAGLGAFRHLHADMDGKRVGYTPGRWGCFFLHGHSPQKLTLGDKTMNARQIKHFICRI